MRQIVHVAGFQTFSPYVFCNNLGLRNVNEDAHVSTARTATPRPPRPALPDETLSDFS